EFGSRYPTVVELSINATNASKKMMVKEWVYRENVSVSLPNIFDRLKLSSYLGMDTATFVVIDKPEYDLVLGNSWITRLGYDIDKQDTRY
ncbi:2751_t:CDS:1, partial [Dentiscutata heterogama]